MENDFKDAIHHISRGIIIFLISLMIMFIIIIFNKMDYTSFSLTFFIIPSVLSIMSSFYLREGFNQISIDGYRAGEYFFRYGVLLFIGIIILLEKEYITIIMYISGIIILISAFIFLVFGTFFLSAGIRQIGKIFNEPLTKYTGILIEIIMLFAIFDIGLVLFIPLLIYYLIFVPIFITINLFMIYIGLKKIEHNIK